MPTSSLYTGKIMRGIIQFSSTQQLFRSHLASCILQRATGLMFIIMGYGLHAFVVASMCCSAHPYIVHTICVYVSIWFGAMSCSYEQLMLCTEQKWMSLFTFSISIEYWRIWMNNHFFSEISNVKYINDASGWIEFLKSISVMFCRNIFLVSSVI